MLVLRLFSKSRRVYITIPERVCQLFLALPLLMALVFRANDHHFSVSLDDLALVAHGFDGRTNFHILIPLCLLFVVFFGLRFSGFFRRYAPSE